MPRTRAVNPLFFIPLSAILYILAFPNFHWTVLAWVALVPLLLIVHESSPRQAFLFGWLAGLLAYSGLLYWILVTFQAAHQSFLLSIPCLLALSAYLGLYWGAWAWFLSKINLKDTHYLPLLSAAAWVALEYIRTYLFSGFPWTLLGDSQYRNLHLLQMASVTGVYGISFLMVFFNTSLSLAFRKQYRPLVYSVALVMVCLAGGYYRLSGSEARPTGQGIRVALLQGSIDQYKKWDHAYVEEIKKTYEELIARAAANHPQLILWPETSVPGYLLQDPPLREWLTGVIKKTRAEQLIGAPVIHNEKSYNAAFLMNPNGDIVGEYAKQHLVPFGEIVPWAGVLGRWISVLNELGGFAAGHKSPVVPAASQKLGVNICYEAIFPALVRDSVRQGATLIANITNDGWYMKTSAPYQHLAPNVLRAVENGRWVMRADNTGVTALIDPYGRITAESGLFEPTVIEGIVIPRNERTPYTRFGDWLAWLSIGFCAWIWLRAILQRR